MMQLSPEEREGIAKHRFDELDTLLRASGCATTPEPASLAINFHTGKHLMVVQLNRDDPRQIAFLLVFTSTEGDIEKARWACAEATRRQFAAKATAQRCGQGYQVTLSVGVYADVIHSLLGSLDAYVDELGHLYDDFVDLMVSDWHGTARLGESTARH